ncbi:GtrA family protein [Microbulbifer pacificus]|uniref:GtrA family protein n=1 Tax=Microbulbifer pacificus TaxID=407164 RepID=A0AAU0N2K7_9GAMM|nr:GtrA family protein [Microbulbifer pacificus]WOX06157.1 GtrA family protein [Microbulbifer pacificus]
MPRSDHCTTSPRRCEQLLGRAVRFAAVGGVATAVQYLLLVALVELAAVGEVVSSALAFGLAAVFNYLLNFHLTFGGGSRHWQALPKFVVVAALGLATNTLCFSLALPLLPYLLAQLIATLVTLVGNFILHQYWIYREPQWNP